MVDLKPSRYIVDNLYISHILNVKIKIVAIESSKKRAIILLDRILNSLVLKIKIFSTFLSNNL